MREFTEGPDLFVDETDTPGQCFSAQLWGRAQSFCCCGLFCKVKESPVLEVTVSSTRFSVYELAW